MGKKNQPNQNVTIAEIAKLADVSNATVSRVLNKQPNVSRGNREKVENLLAQYDYVQRRDPPNKKYTAIGLILPDISNPWFPSLMKGVENIARLHNMNLVLFDCENDPVLEQENVDGAVARGIEGLIVVPTAKDSPADLELLEQDFPVVFLDRGIEPAKTNKKIHLVTSDNYDGAYQAARYLLSLGHKQIVYVAGSERVDTETHRRNGFLNALTEEGIGCDSALVVRGEYRFDLARESISELVESHAKFTAIFASDDVMAYGAKVALESHGLSVPNDISLIGFDDIRFSELIGLTTVAQSPFELGKNAAILLNDIIGNRVVAPRVIKIPTRLIIRSTCTRR